MLTAYQARLDSEQPMLQWTIPFLVAIATIGPLAAADVAPADRGPPPGLATPYPSRPVYARPRQAEETPDLLFTPTDGIVRAIRPLVSGPLLPGSSALPGYYGSSHSYDYQGPYYGSPSLGYWNRLPYACGVYGYC
jgi:hypothetical protein